MDNEDKYLQYKYKLHNNKVRSQNLQKTTQRAVRKLNTMRQEQGPNVANKLIEQ